MKNKVKKKIALLISALLLFGSFTMIGCSKEDAKTSDTKSNTEVTDKKDSNSDKNDKGSKVENEDENGESVDDSSSDSKDSKKGKKNDPSKNGKTWVPAVYKTVHHKEEGHYESTTSFRCKCGQLFPSKDAWYRHWKAYMADNGGVCDRTHDNGRFVTQEHYVVDRAAYTEKVLVKKGYWK